LATTSQETLVYLVVIIVPYALIQLIVLAATLAFILQQPAHACLAIINTLDVRYVRWAHVGVAFPQDILQTPPHA
jgi:hypothetical protein